MILPHLICIFASVGTPLFANVGVKKLIIMSVGTLGLYTLYWDYQNWRLLEQRTHNGGRQVLLLRLISCVSVRLRVRFLFFGFVNLYKRFALCHTARFPSLIVRGSSRLVLCVCIFFSIFFFLFFFILSFFLLVICFFVL